MGISRSERIGKCNFINSFSCRSHLEHRARFAVSMIHIYPLASQLSYTSFVYGYVKVCDVFKLNVCFLLRRSITLIDISKLLSGKLK